jgi:hypothetical protein
MIQGKAKEKLNAEAILSKVDDYNIISFYLGEEFDFKRKFQSPFREKGTDNKPNLCFFPGENDRILFKDFANGIGGDCFKFVQEKFKINFHEALQKIDADFGLGIKANAEPKFKIQLTKKPDSIHKQTKLIQVIPRSFTPEELAYWADYEITEQELIEHNVFSIEKLYINKQLVANYKKELRFAYLFDDYLKIYSPLSQEFKWISSCPNDYISGFDKIKHKVFTGTQDIRLIISKSVKDEIVLSKFFKDVCSTQNESSASINDENMSYILKGYPPKSVYISYDNDEAGVRASQYYTEGYGFNYVNVPRVFRREGIKDWSDLVKHKGLDTMENYLKIKKLI